MGKVFRQQPDKRGTWHISLKRKNEKKCDSEWTYDNITKMIECINRPDQWKTSI